MNTKKEHTLINIVVDGDLLKLALVLSLIIHLVIFVKLSFENKNLLKRSFKNMEVTYYRLQLQTQKADLQLPKKETDKEKIFKKTEVLLEKKDTPLTPIKDISKLDNTLITNTKQPAMITQVQVKRKVTVPPLKSEKITNPLYQNYYQAIRTMIKDRAYANYHKLDTGEVYLTFVLTSNGTLKQVQLMEERSTATHYLREVSLKSIKESTPFPPFPKDLVYPELSFNVVISFEVDK